METTAARHHQYLARPARGGAQREAFRQELVALVLAVPLAFLLAEEGVEASWR